MSETDEPIVAMEFSGCTADEWSRNRAMQQTHDNLIRLYPVRLGPVEWRFFTGAVAAEKLRLAGLGEKGRGLIAWLMSTPGAELLITSVLVPAQMARLEDIVTADDVLRRMTDV